MVATPIPDAIPTPIPTPTPAANALPGALSGHLRDAQGRALASVTVLAVAADGSDAGETVTDDDGFFLISALHAGRYAVFAGLETALASRVPVRGAAVRSGTVSRIELAESARGAVVRVHAREADGRDAPAQAVLVAGAPGVPSSFGSLLASEAIYLPDLGDPRSVLPNVPAGVYTVVLLRHAGATPIAARDPVRVPGEGEIAIDVRIPAGESASVPAAAPPGRVASRPRGG
ncbi:carboxypeptidase-like regulatory domain-containing protein [Anaeromyxobacter oryzae]|nr:carboxypeptidase-like regulatory domain-containing protein [Anaeromyxobacter oryzae]